MKWWLLLKEKTLPGVEIVTGMPDMKDIDTVTMYRAGKSEGILFLYHSVASKSDHFQSVAENPELAAMATEAGIEVIDACTLVLLATGQY